MGFIRGGLFVIVSVLFFITLLVNGIFLTVSSSLKYNVLKPELFSLAKGLIHEKINLTQIISKNLDSMKLYCQNNSDFVFNERGQTFVVSCEDVKKGPDAIINASISNFIDDVYYRNYNCGFIQCFKQMSEPFFLISKQTRDYLRGKFYLTLLILLALAAIMFFLIQNKANFLIVAGALFIVSSLFFAKLVFFISLFPKGEMFQFITIFFTQSHSTFVDFLIVGIFLFLAWIILKFFKVGFKISSIISKLKKKGRKF